MYNLFKIVGGGDGGGGGYLNCLSSNFISPH